MLRLQPDLLSAVDKFVDEKAEMSRPEVIRAILRDWFRDNDCLPDSPHEGK